MTKKISAILVAVMLCLSMLAISASAYTQQYVYDPDYHLTDDEIYELNNYAASIENKTGYAIIFCIISDNFGDTNEEYAEGAYDAYSDSANAIVYVHNTAEKVYDYYIAGDSKNVFNDNILNAMKLAYDTNDSYYGGLMGFYAAAETALENAYYAEPDGGDKEHATTHSSGVTEFEKVERTLPLITDDADLIPDDIEAQLLARCEKIAEEYNMEVAIHTTDSFGGLIAQAYADDYYDFNGYGWGENDDGMLLVYKPGAEGEREIYITTHGLGDSKFFQGIREGIIDEMINPLIDEDYEKAFTIYLDRAEAQLKPGVSVMWLFILMLGGAVVGLLITGSMAAKNKSVHKQETAKVYTRQGSMQITNSADVFLHTRTETTAKPKNNDDSDSSTHTSSSGRSHNGSGAKF